MCTLHIFAGVLWHDEVTPIRLWRVENYLYSHFTLLILFYRTGMRMCVCVCLRSLCSCFFCRPFGWCMIHEWFLFPFLFFFFSLNHTYLNCISLYTLSINVNMCYTHSIFNRTLEVWSLCVCVCQSTFATFRHITVISMCAAFREVHQRIKHRLHITFILFIILLRTNSNVHLFTWLAAECHVPSTAIERLCEDIRAILILGISDFLWKLEMNSTAWHEGHWRKIWWIFPPSPSERDNQS